jgi:hypothetical protein
MMLTRFNNYGTHGVQRKLHAMYKSSLQQITELVTQYPKLEAK